MMKFGIFAKALCAIAIMGLLFGLVFQACDYSQADPAAKAVAGAIDASEPVVSALEDATGHSLSDDTISKGEQIAAIAQKGAAVGTVITKFTPTLIDDAIATAIGALAGAAYGFFQRRKAKALAKAAVVAAHETPGGGGAISFNATQNNVEKEITNAYADAIASGVIDPRESATTEAEG